jgi:SAM-dependent methyltransferase
METFRLVGSVGHGRRGGDAGAPWRTALHAGRASLRGELPRRYTESEWAAEFHRRVSEALVVGGSVLDVGAGRTPTVQLADRPEGTRYVGLDLSGSELEEAPDGSYDDMVVGDVTDHRGNLMGSFDLIVCFQVLEHVRPLGAAFENMRSYLKPGGRLVAQFSGTFSLFGLANRVMPQRVTQKIIDKILSGHGYTTFPAYYDRCWQTAVERLLQRWPHVDVVPYYAGLGYFDAFPPIRAGYLAWEEWTMAHHWGNLSPYYIVDART